MEVSYAFWNNKGGIGKTSLSFQAITRYAEKHPRKRILAIDFCPQANLSELLLGGIDRSSSEKIAFYQAQTPRCTIGGYVEMRLPTPFLPPRFKAHDFIVTPSEHNDSIPSNIDLVCGDPLLELQANAANSLANQTIPGIDPWSAVMDWAKDFLDAIREEYDTVFFDCNPSFSLFTQMALANTDRIILPVMADNASRRAISNVFLLVYGLNLTSNIYLPYSFPSKINHSGRKLPKVHLIVKNRAAPYTKNDSAYAEIFKKISDDVQNLLESNAIHFSFGRQEDGFVEVEDFQEAGMLSFSKGIPFSRISAGEHDSNWEKIYIGKESLEKCIAAIDNLVDRL